MRYSDYFSTQFYESAPGLVCYKQSGLSHGARDRVIFGGDLIAINCNFDILLELIPNPHKNIIRIECSLNTRDGCVRILLYRVRSNRTCLAQNTEIRIMG